MASSSVGKRWILAPSVCVACWLGLSAVPSFEWTRVVPAWFANDHALLGLIEQLSREPSTELFMGGISIAVCAVLPVVLAWRAYVHGASRTLRWGSFAAYVVAWVCVVIAFDAYMFFGGLLTCCGLLWFSTGALMRVIVLVTMFVFAFRARNERNLPAVSSV